MEERMKHEQAGCGNVCFFLRIIQEDRNVFVSTENFLSQRTLKTDRRE